MLKVTNNIMLTEQEIREIADLGKSEQEIQKQIEKFKNGFPILTALSPAIVGDGIAILTNEECLKYAGSYEMADLEVVKFVPASGAASRMFKSLNTAIINNEESDEIKLFAASIDKFAFSNLVSSDSLVPKPPHKITIFIKCYLFLLWCYYKNELLFIHFIIFILPHSIFGSFIIF